VDTEAEVRELVGLCLWDVFSDSHDVLASDGRRLELGSFRASGGFLAEVLNRQVGAERYEQLDFNTPGLSGGCLRSSLLGTAQNRVFHVRVLQHH